MTPGIPEHDVIFDAMGSHVRLMIGDPAAGAKPADEVADEIRQFVLDFDLRLSRFQPGSELCALNEDRRERVPSSKLLREAVKAGLTAAERSGGLVDPTLVREIESVGYVQSRIGMEGASLAAALSDAPLRRPAKPSPSSNWKQIQIDDVTETIIRPPGLRFDTGGTGKGLAADLIANKLRHYSRFIVDCGGDIKVGGPDALAMPYEVLVEHPETGQRPFVLRLRSGAVATSAINVRLWRTTGGHYAHHLLDPSTGAPAWTGIISATAIGKTALEAETLAKFALLSGPEDGRIVLADLGGLFVHDNGRTETAGPLSVRPRVRFPRS